MTEQPQVSNGNYGKNVINTFTGTYTKDLVSDGTAMISLTFTEEEKKQIYAKMREMNIVETTNLTVADRSCFQTPSWEDNWLIRMNEETFSRSWTDQNCQITDDALKLQDLREYIVKIVESKEGYKRMPPARGGYL